MSSNDFGPKRPNLTDSLSPTGESPGLLLSKLLKRKGLNAGRAQVPLSPRVRDGSSPELARESRRVSAGSATDPIFLKDDEPPISPGDKSESAVDSSSETPPPPTRASGELSGLTTPATPSPLTKKSKSAPAVARISNSGRKTPPAVKLDPQELDLRIAGLVERSLTISAIRNTIKGNNYVFTVLNPNVTKESLVKVGFSKDTIPNRQSKIQSKCKHAMKQKLNPNQRPIRLHKRAEALIKADLHNTIHEFECTHCHMWHREYFTASAAVALEVTQRWTAFCEKEPWDENGNLHPFWAQRLLDREVCSEEEDDYVRRAERWSGFVNASWWDRATYNAACLSESIWPYRWQLACSIQTLFLVCVTFPDAWVILLGWIIHVVIVLDMSFENSRFITMFSQRRVLCHKRTLSSEDSNVKNERESLRSGNGIEGVFGRDEIWQPQDTEQEMDIDRWRW